MARCLIRMLALAYRDVEVPCGADGGAEPDGLEAADLERGLTLVGVVGLKDPLRPEVAGAIAQCQRAGITVRMLTGALNCQHKTLGSTRSWGLGGCLG